MLLANLAQFVKLPKLHVHLIISLSLVRTMLLALVGFMPTDGKGTIGSLDCTPEARRQMAIRYTCTCTHVF